MLLKLNQDRTLIQQIQINKHNLNGLGNHQEEERGQTEHLVIFICPMEIGPLMVSHILQLKEQILNGGGQECLVEELIIGVEFL